MQRSTRLPCQRRSCAMAKHHTLKMNNPVWTDGQPSLVQRWTTQPGPALDTPAWSSGGHPSLVQRWTPQPGPVVDTPAWSIGGHPSLVQPGPAVDTPAWSSGGHPAWSTHGLPSLVHQWTTQPGPPMDNPAWSTSGQCSVSRIFQGTK